ncbi:MAG: hypothetical protein JKY08_06010 [Flavobacteriaceae bacterium]|nr:hypothetical protein [Flavobacteriaceae bacterium]
MSRKTKSFDQLSNYMDSEKSDQRFDLHHNIFTRGQENIAAEFMTNSDYLSKRKNGNYLYHEILSVTLEEGVDLKYAKDSLRDIAQEYISKRCPNNMVFGCLHEDHTNHVHYHLMISANERDERKRLRLPKANFEKVKRDLENHVLEKYPELKQKKVITASNQDKKLSRKASDQKRRTGRLDRQEFIADTVRKAMNQASSFEAFKSYLNDNNFEYGTRGKNYKVTVTHDNGKVVAYRFVTVGVHEEFESYLDLIAPSERYQEPKKRTRRGKKEESSAEQGEKQEDGSKAKNNFKAEDAQKTKAEDQNAKNTKNNQKPNEPFTEPKTEKSAFARDVENIYEKKKAKKAKKQAKTLKRKPPKL